jgi:hypothetical protein
MTARYLPEAREVSVGADRAASKVKLTVHVRNRVPSDLADFTSTFCGGSEDRALEWIASHIVSDENVDVRNEIEGLVPEKNESPEQFAARLETVAQGAVDGWTCEKTRRIGTGTTSKAKAMDEVSAMVLAGKSPAEIQSKLAEFAARFGVSKK